MSPAELKDHETQPALPSPPAQKLLDEPEEPSGSPLRKWIVILIVLAAVGGATWKIRKNSQETAALGAAPGGGRGGQGGGVTPVTTAPVEEKSMPIYLTALGTVTAYNTVTVKSRVDGQLLSVNVREGQSVKKGQPLAKIDPAPYAATLAQAEGNLIKDQATAANADAQATRYKALLDAGVVSKENEQLQATSAGQAQGSIAADQAAIQAAKVNLAYTTISSPIDGVVGLRLVDAGNIVHAGDANGLLVVTQLQPIAVIFTLPEDQLPQVQALTKGGKTLPVEAYDRSGTTHIGSGRLLTLDNQIDTTTGTVKAKAVFDNKDGALFPNQFVNVRLILQDRNNAIVIPAAALQTGSQGTFVYVVKHGQAPVDPNAPPRNGGAAGGGAGRRAGDAGAAAGAGAAGAGAAPAGPPAEPYYVEARPVKVDLTEGAQVILSSGVSKGEQVVIDGQERLRNFARVNPRDANAPPGGGGRGGRNRGGAGAAGAGAAGAGAADGSGAQAPGTRGQGGGGRSEAGGSQDGTAGTNSPRGARGPRGDGSGGQGSNGAGKGAGGDGTHRRRDGGNGGGGTQQ